VRKELYERTPPETVTDGSASEPCLRCRTDVAPDSTARRAQFALGSNRRSRLGSAKRSAAQGPPLPTAQSLRATDRRRRRPTPTRFAGRFAAAAASRQRRAPARLVIPGN